ncbi:hypothetical protein ACFXKD_22465 [Nocardiopsis aegyptia]|uniref:hypothetical protein n=1 Tax=Nocardiopsis aegyptia TaxID=220378 RepID=UPI00366D76FB
MTRLSYWAYAIAIALAVSGCGTAENGSTAMDETITQDEAAEKVTEHIEGLMASLPDEAELETRQGMNFASCDDPTDGGPRGRITVSERFWIRGLPVEDNETSIELMYEHWTSNGYRVLRDERPDKQSISVEDEEDSFRMSLRVSDQGSLSIGASSYCVWPEGTPEA